jgi:hypothetical protein
MEIDYYKRLKKEKDKEIQKREVWIAFQPSS